MSVTSYQLPYCTVTGTFVAVDADSADEDAFPDVQPLNGTITLMPTTSAGRVDDAFAQIRPVTMRVFGGQIVDDEDLPGVRILATDANIGVTDWAWRASFKFDGLSLDPLTFKAPRDTTLNLTSGLVPIKSQPYQIVEGASIVDSENDPAAGRIRFKLSDGAYTRWVPGVGEKGERGTKGDRGEQGPEGTAASLAMGSVTTGSTADMWMTGPQTDRQLHAVLPRGAKGERGDTGERGPSGQSVARTAPGAFSITGGGVPAWDDITGKPSTYAPTAHTHPVSDVQGLAARLAVLEYDSGVRNIITLATGASGLWTLRRIGKFVHMALDGVAFTPTSGTTWSASGVIPTGFRPSAAPAYLYNPGQSTGSTLSAAGLRVNRFGGVDAYDVATKTLRVSMVWPTDDPVPTTLPGTPA